MIYTKLREPEQKKENESSSTLFGSILSFLPLAVILPKSNLP